jgi:hypothetical protein
MNSDWTHKKIFNTTLDGARHFGRPKLRWKDGVDQDMRILGARNWKKVALNRDEWTKLIRKARAHQGAVEPMITKHTATTVVPSQGATTQLGLRSPQC